MGGNGSSFSTKLYYEPNRQAVGSIRPKGI